MELGVLPKTFSSWLPALGQLLCPQEMLPGSACSFCHLPLPSSSLQGSEQPWAREACWSCSGALPLVQAEIPWRQEE